MNNPSYYTLFFTILGSYFIPFVALSIYGQSVASPQGSWKLFSLGLFLAATGSLFLFFAMRRWAGIDFSEKPKTVLADATLAMHTLQASSPEVWPISQKGTLEEIEIAFKKYMDMASKITETHSFGASGKRHPAKYKALEQRRLFDNLRTDQEHIVLVYTPKEQKFLYVNPQVTSFLGWSPEKFGRQFSELIAEGEKEWNAAVKQQEVGQEQAFNMILKSKDGVVIPFQCLVGNIPTGVLSQHLLAVLSAK